MLSHRQILFAALTAFNEQGASFTLKQLAAPPGRLYSSFNSKAELISQLVLFRLNDISQMTREPPQQSLAAELCTLLVTYRALCTPFSQVALSDLERHYPEEWGRIMELRARQWQRIAATVEAGVVSRRLRPVDPNLLRIWLTAYCSPLFSRNTFPCRSWWTFSCLASPSMKNRPYK
ncbi:TetR/AcrR family transcriptional regulator [bacterium BFN5]|nr:TetR/AcrR family transcriptional regulator [bacterium BFN5]